MTVNREQEYYISLVHELRKLPHETEWVEFKQNYVDEEDLGEYLSALSNAAAMCGKVHAYMMWGVDDGTHEIVGTTFYPQTTKVGNEEEKGQSYELMFSGGFADFSRAPSF